MFCHVTCDILPCHNICHLCDPSHYVILYHNLGIFGQVIIYVFTFSIPIVSHISLNGFNILSMSLPPSLSLAVLLSVQDVLQLSNSAMAFSFPFYIPDKTPFLPIFLLLHLFFYILHTLLWSSFHCWLSPLFTSMLQDNNYTILFVIVLQRQIPVLQ